MVTDKNIDNFDQNLDELLRLPRFSPSVNFSDRVMSRVAVSHQRSPVGVRVAVPEPRRPIALPPRAEWAIPPAIARWIPASGPARYAAIALASISSLATTAAAIVVISNLSLASFVGSLALDRLTIGMTLWSGELVNGALGQVALRYMNNGGSAQIALVMGGLAAGGIAALAALNQAASPKPRTI